MRPDGDLLADTWLGQMQNLQLRAQNCLMSSKERGPASLDGAGQNGP